MEIPSTLGMGSKWIYYRIKKETQIELPSRTEVKLCISLFPEITSLRSKWLMSLPEANTNLLWRKVTLYLVHLAFPPYVLKMQCSSLKQKSSGSQEERREERRSDNSKDNGWEIFRMINNNIKLQIKEVLWIQSVLSRVHWHLGGKRRQTYYTSYFWTLYHAIIYRLRKKIQNGDGAK